MPHCCLLSATIFILTITAIIISGNAKPISNNIKYELDRNRQSLALLKNIIEEMDTNLSKVFKRGCQINLPGFDCENGEVVRNVNDLAWWGDSITPGKKRGGCVNADGSGCTIAQIADEFRNRQPWFNGPGRRKRNIR
ncbi:hypothetical protein CHUAL_007533 [Chamberlinius hualienensis]